MTNIKHLVKAALWNEIVMPENMNQNEVGYNMDPDVYLLSP